MEQEFETASVPESGLFHEEIHAAGLGVQSAEACGTFLWSVSKAIV